MSFFINTTETIGILIGTATEVTTGSLFLTLFIILLLVMAIAMLFQIPLEFTSILVLPLLLTYMAYYSDWVALGLALFFYIAFIMAKRFILR